MKYDPAVHHRRSIRLVGYDYAQAGAYFVTVCSRDRSLLLDNPQVVNVVRDVWQSLVNRLPAISLDEFVIMPNHVHGIIVLQDRGVVRAQQASAPTLGKVLRTFKSLSAIEANRVLGRSRLPFWQRNYYEHVIRNEDDFDRVRQYIRDNPLKWAEDPENPANHL